MPPPYRGLGTNQTAIQVVCTRCPCQCFHTAVNLRHPPGQGQRRSGTASIDKYNWRQSMPRPYGGLGTNQTAIQVVLHSVPMSMFPYCCQPETPAWPGPAPLRYSSTDKYNWRQSMPRPYGGRVTNQAAIQVVLHSVPMSMFPYCC